MTQGRARIVTQTVLHTNDLDNQSYKRASIVHGRVRPLVQCSIMNYLNRCSLSSDVWTPGAWLGIVTALLITMSDLFVSNEIVVLIHLGCLLLSEHLSSERPFICGCSSMRLSISTNISALEY